MVDQVVHGVGVLTAACFARQDEDGGPMNLREHVLKGNCIVLVRLSIGTVVDSKGNAHVVGYMRMNGTSLRIWVTYKQEYPEQLCPVNHLKIVTNDDGNNP